MRKIVRRMNEKKKQNSGEIENEKREYYKMIDTESKTKIDESDQNSVKKSKKSAEY